MAYEKLNLTNGEALDESHLAHMEQGIADALPATELDAAIDAALLSAKESGAFDGQSVTIAAVEESDEDGGENIVTFSDGTTLIVKNGKAGSGSETVAPGEDDEGKILQVVDGAAAWVSVEESAVAAYIDAYITDALGGEY